MSSRDGGNKRFEEIYRRYYARVWRYLRACGVSDDEAHDLAQDTFKRLFERMKTIRGEDEWPFLQSIARSIFLNWLRGRRTQKRDVAKRVELDGPGLTTEPSAVALPDYAEEEQRALRVEKLREAITELSPGQRECISLWLNDISYVNIAKTLGISVDAVKSRIRDAKRLLSARLGEPLPEEQE